MRLLVAALVNVVLALLALLSVPGRLLRRGSRPEWVRLRLEGDLPYRPARRKRLTLLSRPRPSASDVRSVQELRRALERLGSDAGVKGILLQVKDVELSPAKRAAVTAELAAFRARGKQVVAFAVSAGNAELELLCAADQVLMPAAGRLELTGYAAEATALAEGLERLGVKAHFVRRGDYKTAPELFTHADVSDIQRRTIEALLDERYQDLVEVLSRGRRLTPEQARERIDLGPYSARRALAAGLIDGLCSEADLPERLAGPEARPGKEGAPPKAKVGSLKDYLASLPFPLVRWRPFRLKPLVAVVPVRGAIIPGEGGAGGMRTAGAEAVVRALRAVERHRRVKAAVLYVDSPGGSALASELILEAVQRLEKKKPVVAFTDRVAASGGYMAAMGAREFWSAPGAIVGSIGVFAGKFELSGLLARLGVRRAILTRGQNAGLFSTSRGFTESERAALEAEVEETYQAFLQIVAAGRKRTVEEVHARAEGRVYSGKAALEAGLVDRLGGFEEVCRHALGMAGVREEAFDVAVVTAARRASLLQSLLKGAGQTQLWALAWPFFRFPHLGRPGSEAP